MDGEPTIDPEAARGVIDHGRLGPGRVGIQSMYVHHHAD